MVIKMNHLSKNTTNEYTIQNPLKTVLLPEIALRIITKYPRIHCSLLVGKIREETLAKKAPKMNPKTKYIAMKYHLF